MSTHIFNMEKMWVEFKESFWSARQGFVIYIILEVSQYESYGINKQGGSY